MKNIEINEKLASESAERLFNQLRAKSPKNSATGALRLKITAIGKRAVVGKQHPTKQMFSGKMHDVHSDFLAAIIEFCGEGKLEHQVTIDGKPAYTIKVTKYETID